MLFSIPGNRMVIHLKEAAERGLNEGTSYRTPTVDEMEFSVTNGGNLAHFHLIIPMLIPWFQDRQQHAQSEHSFLDAYAEKPAFVSRTVHIVTICRVDKLRFSICNSFRRIASENWII